MTYVCFTLAFFFPRSPTALGGVLYEWQLALGGDAVFSLPEPEQTWKYGCQERTWQMADKAFLPITP